MDQKTINKRINAFRDLCLTHVYSEPDTPLHKGVMDQMIDKIQNQYPPEGKALDVGCGTGYAMQRFTELGNKSDWTGLTLSHTDAEAARARGFDVVEQDMSFTDFADETFDYLWVRHSLEHSPYPLLTLLEFYRIMKPGAAAYIEMPSPKCDRLLEAYDNHYSIMGSKQWICLMKRAGFVGQDFGEIDFEIMSHQPVWKGREVYEWYIILKPVKPVDGSSS